jgi:hypothetical protein
MGVVISNAPNSFIVVEGVPADPFCFAINSIPERRRILPAASLLVAKLDSLPTIETLIK